MQVLRAVSVELHRFPLVTASLAAFAGPQCFPHLKNAARVRANDVERGDAAAAVSARSSGFRQLEEGWLQCDACGKWRLVDRGCLPSLAPAEFSVRRPGCSDFDWGAWVDEAPERYRIFLEEMLVGSGGGAVEAAEVPPADVAPSDPRVGPHGEKEEAEVKEEVEEQQEEERAGARADAASDVSKSSPDSSECASDDGERAVRGSWRSELDSALTQLGARGGGLRAAEVQEQARLLKQVAAEERGLVRTLKRQRTEVLPQPPERVAGAPLQAIFRCDMLLKQEARGEGAVAPLEWAPMTCADEDDVAALLARA